MSHSIELGGKIVLLLDHRKTTSREGYHILLRVAYTCVGLILFQFLLHALTGEFWTHRLFVVIFNTIIAVCTVAGVIIGIRTLNSDGIFRCRLTTDILDCHCPVKGFGDSFSIRIDCITKVEIHEKDLDARHKWYIWDQAGRRYWLTYQFNNPDDEVIQLIKQLRPSLPEIRT